MFSAILGTSSGVHRLVNGELEPLGLADQRISAIHAWQDPDDKLAILAGTYGNGLFRSENGGNDWTVITHGLTAHAFRTIVSDPTETGAILAGTEPARLFRSRDGGATWSEFEGIPRLDGHETWYLPYSPREGALRNVYAPLGGKRLLASVEVGGLLNFNTWGGVWSFVPVFSDPDIHHVTGHPDDPNLLFVSIGWAGRKNERRTAESPRLGGVARSRDGGQSWEKFHTDYTRATIVPPSRKDLLLAGPALEVGAQGRIEVSADSGDTWEPAGNGIETPMADMVELFVPAPDNSIWAIRSSGGLMRAEPGTWKWTSVLPADSVVHVESVAYVPD